MNHLVCMILLASAAVSCSVTDRSSRLGGRPYRFTPRQIATLKSFGCVFDHSDRDIALRMAGRGFTARQFVQAWSDLHRIAPGERRHPEAVAVFRLMRLNWRHFRKYVNSRKSLTYYYNREIIGGRGRRIGGWILFGFSVPAALVGAILLAATQSNSSDNDLEKTTKTFGRGFGAAALGGGVLGMGLGLWLGITGNRMVRSWVKRDLLDRGPVDQIYRHRRGRAERRGGRRPSPAFFVSPALSPLGGSHTVGLRW